MIEIRPRYVFALVSRVTGEIKLPAFGSRREAREQLQWEPEADNLKIERCRLLPCRRERTKACTLS